MEHVCLLPTVSAIRLSFKITRSEVIGPFLTKDLTLRKKIGHLRKDEQTNSCNFNVNAVLLMWEIPSKQIKVDLDCIYHPANVGKR